MEGKGPSALPLLFHLEPDLDPRQWLSRSRDDWLVHTSNTDISF